LYAFLEDHEEIALDGDPTESLQIGNYAGTQAKRDAEHESEEDHIYLTRDEVEQLSENVPTKNPLRNELIVRLLFETGVRIGELSRVKLENVDRENGDILVKSSKKRQRTEYRTVHYWSEATERLLTLWLDKGHRAGIYGASDSPYLFPTAKRERVREQAINDVVKQAAESAGLQEEQYEDAAGRTQWKITAHTLRHSCAMHLLNNGATVAHVKKLLGHTDIQTTQQYTDPSADNTREVVRKLRGS
jgi:integrase/recombinase XerD